MGECEWYCPDDIGAGDCAYSVDRENCPKPSGFDCPIDIKLRDWIASLPGNHAPDEIGGTDEGSEGSGSGPEAVNEPES